MWIALLLLSNKLFILFIFLFLLQVNEPTTASSFVTTQSPDVTKSSTDLPLPSDQPATKDTTKAPSPITLTPNVIPEMCPSIICDSEYGQLIGRFSDGTVT